MVEDFLTEHFSLTLTMFCFQVMSKRSRRSEWGRDYLGVHAFFIINLFTISALAQFPRLWVFQ
jgi:hypothetical protein